MKPSFFRSQVHPQTSPLSAAKRPQDQHGLHPGGSEPEAVARSGDVAELGGEMYRNATIPKWLTYG